MWCDNFDLDLYKVIPQARDVLAPLAGVMLYTHGHSHDGELNHPACWNTQHGMAAFFGFQPTGIKPDSFWTDEPTVLCSFETAIRDCWPHTYCLTMFAAGRAHAIWDSQLLHDEFWELMGHVRGYARKDDETVYRVRARVLASLATATHRLRVVMALCGVQA